MLTWWAPENSFLQTLRCLSSVSEPEAYRDYLTLLYHKHWKWSTWKLIREVLGDPYLLKVPQMSLKFDSKWARRKLQTASSLSLFCSEITSDQINGRLAIQWSFFYFSLFQNSSYWANNYEPLPLDERQFVLPVWFGAEAKWPWKTVHNPSICSRTGKMSFVLLLVCSTLFRYSNKQKTIHL